MAHTTASQGLLLTPKERITRFYKLFNGKTNIARDILEIMYKEELLPINHRFCAVDEDTMQIVGVTLLNSFEPPRISRLLRFMLKLLWKVGFKKLITITKVFQNFEKINRDSEKTCLVDVYLVSTKEGFRGKGVGTAMLNQAFAYIMDGFYDKVPGKTENKISLIVYEDNPAVHLYKRLGFKEVKKFSTQYLAQVMGEVYSSHVLMEKKMECKE